MKKKIAVILLLVALFTATLTACGQKTAVSSAKFKEIANNAGLTVIDETKKHASETAVDGAWEASPPDRGFTASFFKFASAEDAMNEFLYRTDPYENNAKMSDGTNFNKCVCSSDGQYIVVSRVDDSLFFAAVASEYSVDIDGLVSAMGY